MKHYTAYFLLIVYGICFSSCQLNLKDDKNKANIELEPVSINDEFSMGIPGFMTKTASLNEDASLQYQNMFKETYVIVIDENKQEFIDAYIGLEAYDTTRSVLSNYADTQIQLTTSNMEVIQKNKITSLKINGLNAATVQIDANVEGVKNAIAYFLTFIEGKEKLYMVMAWTFRDKKDDYAMIFEKMAKSFQEKAAPVSQNQ